MEIFTLIEQREVNLDLVFNNEDPKTDSNVEHHMRKLGHGMEKKISLWRDVTTFKINISKLILYQDAVALGGMCPLMTGLQSRNQ